MPPAISVTEEQAEILKILKSVKTISQQEIAKKTKKDQVIVAKTVLELSEKGLIDSLEKTAAEIRLTKEGKEYAKKGLPEKQVMRKLKRMGKILLEDFKQKSELDPKIVNIAIGWLRRKKWVEFTKEGKKTFIEAKEISEKDLDEELLTKIAKEETIKKSDLSKKLQERIKDLKKRTLIEVQEKRLRFVQLTDEGRKLVEEGIKVLAKMETTLTPEMIISGSWKTKKFKPYDPTENVPRTFPGRTHPVMEIIKELREIFLEMGFNEIRGTLVESEFWNFDALFQPQDHPARMMHDTFRLAKPSKAKLPSKAVVEKVAKTHENGWKTNSTGWQYKWQRSDAERLVLRTHTTATTVRHLGKAFKEWTPPEKVFSIDRVYRNEKLDYKHLAEFMQVEGIAVDKNVTLRNLMGLLKTFYGKIGFKKIRLIPSYFPYTEPSMSTLIYAEKFKSWLEMGGSGIFRPEVTLPFGVKEKVLAWGQGLDRLVMLKLDFNDLREIYGNDLEQLRNMPIRF